jgi:hypothetical protein
MYALKRTKNWRDGYQKQKLETVGLTGGGRGRPAATEAAAALGGGTGRGGRVGGGWGARVAAREGSGDAFGVMPAPPGAGPRQNPTSH